MSSNEIKAAYQPNEALNLVEGYDGNRQMKLVQPLQVRHRNRRNWVDAYTSIGSSGAVFGAGNNFDFYLISPSIHFVSGMGIKIQLTNNEVSNSMTLVNLPFLFQQIQIFIGATLITTVYPEAIQQYWATSGVEKTTQLAAFSNFDEATYNSSANGVIPAGATVNYFLDLPNLFTQANVPFYFLNAPIRIRLYNTTSPFTSTSTSTNTSLLSLAAMTMNLEGDRINPVQLAELTQTLSQNITQYSGYITERNVQPLGVLTSGQQFSTNLASVQGTMSIMWFWIRQQNATQEAQYQANNLTLYNLDRLTLSDSSGNAVFQNQISGSYLRYYMPFLQMNSKYLINGQNSYPYFLGDVPLDSMLYGRRSDIYVSNNWNLQAFATSAAGNACELVTLTFRRFNLDIQPNGQADFLIL